MISHIIPITFLGGTGGNFIRALLISAKVEYSNLWDISQRGNSHWGPLEMYNEIFNKVPHDLTCTVEDILKCIETSKIKYDPDAIFYQNFHIVELDSIMQHFAKSIRVTYEFSDVHDVCLAMTGKNGADVAGLNLNNFADVKSFYIKRKMIMIKHLKDFTPSDTYENRVLYISWKDIMNEDGKSLFARLSEFTGIPHYNFSADNLNRWRELTNKTVSEMKAKHSYDLK